MTPRDEPLRWGFCWLEETISEQMCHHCELTGVALLVEAEGSRTTSVTLLCPDHKSEHRRLWRAYLPEAEMSAEEAERLAR